MLKKRIYALLFGALILLSGCGENAAPTAANIETSVREAVTVADPQAAVDAIYSSLGDYDAQVLSKWRLTENLKLDENYIVEYYGKISNVNGGLADVALLLPAEGHREDVSLALSTYKEQRIAEFENYDILDAYSIAQNAVIYEQGDYIILLMLKDNDAARAIIDKYIPL